MERWQQIEQGVTPYLVKLQGIHEFMPYEVLRQLYLMDQQSPVRPQHINRQLILRAVDNFYAELAVTLYRQRKEDVKDNEVHTILQCRYGNKVGDFDMMLKEMTRPRAQQTARERKPGMFTWRVSKQGWKRLWFTCGFVIPLALSLTAFVATWFKA